MRQKCMVGALLGVALAIGAGPTRPAETVPPQVPRASDTALVVTSSAEIEKRSGENGHPAVRLMPADHVVAGDLLIYTVEARNAGPTVLARPVITTPIPEHMSYVADSAVAPGAELSFSVDGGRSFDRPENLVAPGPDGAMHRAVAADYTHIRWVLRNSLKANSVAYARFRATLK